MSTLRLLLSAVAVNLALLASLGPVTAFFTLCTESYSFMVVLNVLVFGLSGLTGVIFLKRSLDAVFDAGAATPDEPMEKEDSEPEENVPNSEGDPGGTTEEDPWVESRPPLVSARKLKSEAAGGHASSRMVFRMWVLVYAVVGAQMGWVLRPFIGTPTMPFTVFRVRASNFFEGFIRSLGHLLGG
jgi:hypothetical protein